MQSLDFQIWDASRPEDAERWIALWRSWSRREVFAHPRYVQLFAAPGDAALCAVFAADGAAVLYPFLRRNLDGLPWAGSSDRTATDIATPYGYGGPFTWDGTPTPEFAGAFWRSFDRWAEENNVVSEFIRFSLFPSDLLPYPGDTVQRYPNIVRELDGDDETLWMDFKHKVRKNIKAARRADVQIERDPLGRRLDEFLRIYIGTMDRRSSLPGYYFQREFFEAIHRGLPGQFMYFHALHADRVVSTELVLVSAENVYSFLGGTEDSAFALRPNDLLKHEIIQWARSEGKKRFVLGGGYEPGDGIYQYKLSFAPRGVTPFVTGQRILRAEQYRQIVEQRKRTSLADGGEWTPRVDFFPLYRG